MDESSLSARLRRIFNYILEAFGLLENVIHVDQNRFFFVQFFRMGNRMKALRTVDLHTSQLDTNKKGEALKLELLKHGLAQLNLRHNEVTLNLFKTNFDSPAMIQRHLELEKLQKNRLKAAIHWELKKIIPNAAQKLTSDFVLLKGFESGGQPVFFVGAKKESCEKLYSVFEDLQLYPKAVYPTHLALPFLFNKPSVPRVILYFGSELSALVICHRNMVYNAFTTAGRDHNKIIREMQASYSSFRQHTALPVAQAFICGDNSGGVHPDDVSEWLDCDVRLPIATDFKVPLQDARSSLLEVYALASAKGVPNLIPESRRKTVNWQQIKQKLAGALVGYHLATLLLAYQFSDNEKEIRVRGYGHLSEKIQDREKKITELEHLEGLIGGVYDIEGRRTNKAKMLWHLAKASQAAGAVVQKMKLTPRKVEVQGYIKKGKDLSYFVDYFVEEGKLDSSKWDLATSTKNQGKVKFFTVVYKRRKSTPAGGVN